MITVNNCGYESKHMTALNWLIPNGYNDYVILLIKTNAFFEFNGTVYNTPPNTVIIYEAHSYAHYGCHDSNYNDDWIHFELHGDDCDILEKLNIPLNTPFTLPYIGTLTNYSRMIVVEKFASHAYKEDTLNSLMHALFYSIAAQLSMEENINSSNKYYYPMNALRTEMINAPYKKWDISVLASRIHLSASHFQHLYKEFFGVSCMQDVINARIQYAQYYLRTTEISIHALSELCGYENELHFMRQFKKCTGLTPSNYRKLNR